MLDNPPCPNCLDEFLFISKLSLVSEEITLTDSGEF